MLEALASSMTVGVYCALGDGNIDNRELATLRRWKDDFVSKTPDAIGPDLAAAMEAEIQKSLRGVTEEHLHRACLSQRPLPDQFKVMTMGLAFEIVAADRKVNPSEMASLHKVARLLAISDETFKLLEEKHLKPIQITAATTGHTNASEQERLLGIDPTWSKEQKLAQLTKEFAKYNARMQSARDEAHRAQCRRMLELIAAFREEIITGRKPTPPPSRDTPPPLPRPASGAPRPVIPPPVGSKDESLIGVDITASPRQKLTFLAAEEARWQGRMSNQLPPATLAKCQAALQAIRRLRNVYQAQL
jgi:uncharacterized tellurite resistance protein B-like protein